MSSGPCITEPSAPVTGIGGGYHCGISIEVAKKNRMARTTSDLVDGALTRWPNEMRQARREPDFRIHSRRDPASPARSGWAVEENHRSPR